MNKICRCVVDTPQAIGASLGLLILRAASGFMLASLHGWGKLSSFGATADTFPDPLGVGSRTSLTLAVGAEFFCAILLILGVATRLVVLPLIITMGVAAFVIHAEDPWSKKETALLYLVPFICLLFTGAGRFSVDGFWSRNRLSGDTMVTPIPGFKPA